MTQNSTKIQVVQVSGRGTNVEFIIDDVVPFDQIRKGLRDYLIENRGMWSGGAIAVNVGNRLTSRDELNELKKIIEAGSGLTVIRFSCSPETMASAPDAPDPESVRPLQHNEVIITDRKPTVILQSPVTTDPVPVAPHIIEPLQAFRTPKTVPQHNEVIAPEPQVEGTLPPGMRAAPLIDCSEMPRQTVLPIDEASQAVQTPESHPQHNEVDSEPSVDAAGEQPLLMDEEMAPKSQQASYLQSQRDTALLVKSTCRSGEIIRHQGDVVVMGDVNPGAEVVATGDILVFGCLRGFAHAGSEGNSKATIVALSLGSPRIQIGPHVGVSSSNGTQPKHTDSGPLIAYVRRRSIHVALFEGRFFKYGKGVLYDG
jgi:septum site-determining protein MinC